MQAIVAVIFHFIGGFASGSFYMPYKKVRGWHWESFWIIGGLFSWIIVPPLAAWLTIPDFAAIIAQEQLKVLAITYCFGVLWGIGGLTYGLGVRYLGMSLGNSIILGLTMVFGALIPSIYYQFFPKEGKESFNLLISSHWGLTVLLGLLVAIIGISICGKAGMMKEQQLSLSQATANTDATTGKNEYKFALGMFVAIVSGILSACFNFGIESGKPMSELANQLWKNAHPGQGEFLFQNNVIYIVILWGGMTTNFIWCMILNKRNRTFGDYTNRQTPLVRNYMFSALAGTTWFLQFFFYGMGESKLGNGPSSWILHMAFIILTANMWGLVLKEWKKVNRATGLTILAGISIIILAVLLVGYGNSLK